MRLAFSREMWSNEQSLACFTALPLYQYIGNISEGVDDAVVQLLLLLPLPLQPQALPALLPLL